MKLHLLTIIVALAITPAFAQEREIRQKLESLDKEAAAAKAEGNRERLRAIERVREEIHASIAHRTHGDLPAQLEKARAELADAKKEGRAEEAEQLSQRVTRIERAIHDHAGGPQERGHEPEAREPRERLEHLQQAIRHLHAAGMHEPAESLAKQASEMRRHLEEQAQQKRPHNPHTPKPGGDDQAHAIKELRQALRHMHEQMGAMQKRLEELSREGH